MANSEYNYIPTYIRRTINNRPKDVVTAKYWNELFNLLITQGDHTAEELGNILNYFSTRLVGVESEIAESAEAIANIRGTFRINVTYSNGVYSADKTFAEIKAAYDAGQQPFVVLTGGTFDLVYTLANFDAPTDGSEPKFIDFERYLVGDGILETETLRMYSYSIASGSNIVKRISAFNVPSGSVVIEGTVSDDMSGVTITTPDAWTLVSEAWNSEKRPLVVLRLSDELYAYLTSVSTITVDGQSTGMALFSLSAQKLLDSTPLYSIWMYEDGTARILPVEGINGADGVGIQSVKQTVTSTEDGGTNVITVTKTDGTSSAFTVRNGSKGGTGAAGAAGKDGYTPVRGRDYWTADDITTIQNYVDSRINTELAGTNTLLGSGIQISFTIDGEAFSAVSGETWKEWIGGYSRVISGISGLTLYCSSDDGIILADEAGVNALGLNDVWVHGNETIVSGATYAIIPCGG